MLLEDESRNMQDAIEQHLGEPVAVLQYLSSCDSTNRRCLQQGGHKTIVIAQQQTAGRGRRGRQWVSPAGKNIYCSIGLDKKLPAQYLGLISLCVGVSIAQVLQRHGFFDSGLKWPNDIVVGERKLGGILIETRPLAEDEFYLVTGFGLNVALEESTLASIDQPAISLQQMSAEIPDTPRLCCELVAAIMQAVMSFDETGIDDLLQRFAGFDQYHDREVTVKTRSGTLTGRYRGVHRSGQLQLETVQGLQLFSAAEISLRTQTGSADAVDR